MTRTGFEPMNACVKGMCVQPLHQRAIRMVQVTGLEPARKYPLDPKSSASANFAIPAQVVDPVGLEPTTARL